MNLFGFQITRAPHATRSAAPTLQRSLSPEALAWLQADEPVRSPSLANAYEQVVWVYRAANALAEQVANIPFLFSAGERGRENLITSGPLHTFYNHPHPHLNRFQYWELRVLWLLLRGECIRIPIFEDSSSSSPSSSSSSFSSSSSKPASVPQPSTLNPQPASPSPLPPHANSAFRTPHSALRKVLMLDPAHFQHVIENHQLIGWRYTGGSPTAPLHSQVFLPEEVWFERLPNPFDFWRGLAPLHLADLPAKTDFAAASFMRGLLENNADAGLIVRTDQQLSDEQREQIRAALRERKRRAGAPDRSILLWGATEVVQPRLSSADLQFLENRKFSRAEICAAFGVPEEIITTTDHAKYDVMQGARLNFIENRVAPLCARLEAEEARTVQAIDPQALGWFDLDSLPIMQQARRDRLAAAKTGFDMGIPFNELNRVLDLGFKPLPWGNRGYLPNNLSELPNPAPAEPNNTKVQIPPLLASSNSGSTCNLQPAPCNPPPAPPIPIPHSPLPTPHSDLPTALARTLALLREIQPLR